VLRIGEAIADAVILTSPFIEVPVQLAGSRTGPAYQPKREDRLMQVIVRDNNIEQALRVLKKKMQREGVFREMRRRRCYEKPSEEAARKKSDAVRRMRKLARKQAIRDGLIAAPPAKKKEIKQPVPSTTKS
jgi:small subunit ribosomal protein S21